MSFTEMQNENKIVNIDNIFQISNGTLEELKLVDPNQVGQIVDKKGNILSDITPIIMIINQNKIDVNQRLEIMKENGGDFDKKIDYYNNTKSANDILSTR